MALPLRSEPPAHQRPPAPGCPVRRTPRRPRSAPVRATGTVLSAAAGAHAARGRTALARGAVVAVGIGVFVAVTQLAVLAGPHLVGAAGSNPTAEPAVAQEVVYRVVAPGETLWSIAGELVGGGDLRARVDRLARLNGGAAITAGQTVRIPLDWTQP